MISSPSAVLDRAWYSDPDEETAKDARDARREKIQFLLSPGVLGVLAVNLLFSLLVSSHLV
ncbi:hypothetical protein [Sorangium sp. So ce233]|uniref:hypothetical protein n=1 Tax=Sorangium sp. So ce233 TaxID=3133290 RepID=UPI003F6043FA